MPLKKTYFDCVNSTVSNKEKIFVTFVHTIFIFLVSGYVNNFDALVLYTCPTGGYLNGVFSVHDNYTEDRRYKFRCCTPRSGENLYPMLFSLQCRIL